MPQRRYITTAIDYPNAAPHMGHVLEKMLADVIARWWRLSGADVRFQIGTDEHGIKIQQTAEHEGVTPRVLVDRNVLLFQDLYARLGVSADVFIRTTDQERHWPTVIELWRRLMGAGALEERTYQGLYCSGCERFITEKDLVNGQCELHRRPPTPVAEKNWFFQLSRDGTWLQNLLKSTYHLTPSFREQETLTLLQGGLEDVSFSRPTSSLSWGIPVPDVADQTMYVWCDALTNYASGVDAFDLRKDGTSVWWGPDTEITHVIGKDIARFHALIWPSMLHHAGLRTPDRLLIHGFLTSEGQKMSKSLGNVVRPEEVLSHFAGNPDPLRFYLTHEVPVGSDGDFSWKRIDELYVSVLSNKIGNLLHRVLTLLKKDGGAVAVPADHPLKNVTRERWSAYRTAMDQCQLSVALAETVRLAEEGNALMEQEKPWKLPPADRQIVLSAIAELLRHIALQLLPVMPTTACRLATELGITDAVLMTERNFILGDRHAWGADQEWCRVRDGTPTVLFPMIQ